MTKTLDGAIVVAVLAALIPGAPPATDDEFVWGDFDIDPLALQLGYGYRF
jgi:hypothetical protein